MTDEWTTLGSATTWQSGGTPSRLNPDYWGGSVPWISAFTLKGARLSTSDQSLTTAGVAAGSKVAPEGAVLVLVRGMALHSELRAGVAARPLAFNQDVKAMLPISGVEPEFLLFSLQARESQILKLVTSAGSGTGVLTSDRLKAIPLWIPSIKTQRSICSTIGDADLLIELLERLIAKKRNVKQGVMQELLTGRTRLPGFTGEWVESELASLIDGLIAGTSVRSVAGAPRPGVLKTSAVRAGRVDELEVKRILPEDVSRARCMPEANSILVSRMNTPAMVGEVGYVERDLPGVYLPDRLWLARPRKDAGTNMPWLAALLSFGATAESVRGLATGTSDSMKNIAKSRLLALKVKSPSSSEQNAIGSVLADIDSEIAAVERRLDSARAVKAGMMQELLTGRARLPVKEDA
ncbi:MAG: restriction endonuclease subunit S [Intrasporangium sp.]|uniref:restriction endonuclease subunit S n=1 Tax=Intrasporangium sp. TaxID=1925024 RepID=UPI0026471311|nr:restriction endonuclease subunit S [Intrasporangium sp.]MDN5796310.1 restriction endonuclease subunit S [Intrasporangium sp.]